MEQVICVAFYDLFDQDYAPLAKRFGIQVLPQYAVHGEISKDEASEQLSNLLALYNRLVLLAADKGKKKVSACFMCSTHLLIDTHFWL